MKILPLLLIALLLGACGKQQAFRLEPTNRKTFASTTPLHRGDVVVLRVTGISANQRLRLHRCGPRCNTAETIATWDREQLADDGRISAEIPRDGEYYFWVEDFSQVKGKYGAALVAAGATTTAGTFTVRYEPAPVVAVEGMQSNKTMEPTR
jgi:hypothetical protein